MSLRRYLQDKTDSPLATGAQAGGLALGGIGTKEALATYLRELSAEQMPGLDWDEFQKLLQPGDVIFSRSPNKGYEKKLMQLFSGTNYPHTGVISGKENGKTTMFEAPGGEDVADNYLFDPGSKSGRKGHAAIAYRPDLSKPEIKKGIKGLSALEGADYDTMEELLSRQAKTFTGCGPGSKGTICSDIPSKAFPQVFKEKYSTLGDMMGQAGKPIARLNTGAEIPIMDEILAHGSHGLLKAAKPALMIGGGVAAAAALAKFLRKEDKHDR